MNRRQFGLVLPLLSLACHSASEQEAALKVAVHCVSPVQRPLDERLDLSGHLESPPGGDLPLAAQVAGRILELRVHEGQRVEPGEVVASVDDLASRGALRQAEASLAQASAAELNASATLQRTQALVARGIAAPQELDEATAKAETEKQSVLAGRAALDSAHRTLGRVQVRAAFGGVVTRVFRGPGAIVDGTAATPIAQIAAPAAEFVAAATERDLARVALGCPAQISLEAGSAPLHGEVRAVSSALDASTGLGVVRVSLDQVPKALPMGAHGRLTLLTRHRDAVLMLPVTALRGALADGAEVVLCAANVATIRAVQVGYRDAQYFELIAGLAADETVAVDHVLGLETGTELLRLP
jgi:RND family efflux transporter MFP subunit